MPPFPELVTIARSADREAHRIAQLPILVIHAHSSCNCRCLMCDIWKTKEHQAFRVSDLYPHLGSIRRLGVRWVVFSGGEPLLNSELFELCSIFKREGIHLTLLSTGLLLSKYAQQVADSFDDVIISLDGPEPIHNSIRQVKSAFSIMASGIDVVRRIRPGISISARTTVQKQNHRFLRATVRAAKDLGLNSISFLAADLTSEAFNRPQPWAPSRQNHVSLTADEIFALDSELDLLIQDNAADISRGYIAESPAKLRNIARHFRAHVGLDRTESPRCNAPWVSAVLETDGTVRPCFFHRPVGNLKANNLEEVINGENALGFRSSLDIPSNPVCNRCVCSLNYKS